MVNQDLTILSIDGLGKELIEKPGTYNAFMILSPDQSYHSKKNIEVYCRWALRYCPRFLLYVFDTPHMYDFWAFKNLDPPEAKAKAEKIGLERENGFRKVLRRIGSDRIDLQRHSTFRPPKSWSQIAQVLTEYLINNEPFREDITQDVFSVEWIREKAQQNPQIIEGLTWRHYCEKVGKEANHLYRWALQYFVIEEIGAFIELAEFGGYPVQISNQSQFPVIDNMYQGKYPGLIERLKLSGNVGYIHALVKDS